MPRAKPKIRVRWLNPPGPYLTVERTHLSGRTVERELGPRGRLDLEEAAEALRRPRRDVLAEIRAGFLRACRRGNRLYVTVHACFDFLREEREDIEQSERTLRAIRAGREVVVSR